jgi:hypothetical protein
LLFLSFSVNSLDQPDAITSITVPELVKSADPVQQNEVENLDNKQSEATWVSKCVKLSMELKICVETTGTNFHQISVRITIVMSFFVYFYFRKKS